MAWLLALTLSLYGLTTSTDYNEDGLWTVLMAAKYLDI